jgi:hypothetical protein
VDALRLFWYFEPRMALWGLGFGSGLGTTYGLLLGGLTFPYGVGFLLIGPLFGAVGGLVLGILCSAVLLIFTLAYCPRDASRYRAVAGLVCAAATALAVVSSWEIALQLSSGTASLASGLTLEEHLAETVILVIVPALIAAGAAWWAGRRVAKQYIRDFGEQDNHSREQASHESPSETRRNQ